MNGVNGVLHRHVHPDLALDEQPDDVDSRRERGGHLLAADDVDTERSTHLDRRSELGDGVVVGDAEHIQAEPRGCPNQVRSVHHTVAREGVGMDLSETETLRGTRACARCLLHRPSVIGWSDLAFALLRVR